MCVIQAYCQVIDTGPGFGGVICKSGHDLLSTSVILPGSGAAPE